MNYIYSIWELLRDIVLSIRGKSPIAFDEFEEEREIIEKYRALVKIYNDILDAVFLNTTQTTYIEPGFWLNSHFAHLRRQIIHAQEDVEVLKTLPLFNFNDYTSLTINTDWMIQNYFQKRIEILKYRSEIENLFILKCKMEGRLDEYFIRDLEDYSSTINEFLDIKGGITTVSYPRFRVNTKRYKIYNVLFSKVGEFATLKDISRTTKIKSYGEIRIIINQIQDVIENRDYDKKYKIDTIRNSSYKLTIS
jgi:hypothetical protein